MKNHLRVSIVIPAYNEERHITACLDAIAAQTSPVFEAIVVDNNCTDRTIEIAQRYPFVRIVREKRQGLVFARDAGFNAVKGDIIGRIDADIAIPATWVAHIQDFYADPEQSRFAWTGYGVFTNVSLPRLVSWTYRLMTFRLNRLLLGHCSLWGSNMAMLRRQWLVVRGSIHRRLDIHEDLELAIHVHQHGFGIVYDRTMPVRAHLRRVNTKRDQLWGYLQWWPRTLKIHKMWTWIICWFFGALIMYFAAYFLAGVGWLTRSKPVE